MGETEKPQALNKGHSMLPFRLQNISPSGRELSVDPHPRFLNEAYIGSQKLKGKKALITGGDSGIGRAVAVLFSREGADVAITCLEDEIRDAQETVEAIHQEGQSGLYVVTDLTDPQECKNVVDTVIDNFGRIDILVNNAAYQNHVEDFEQLNVEQFEHTFQVNVFGYFNMVKEALPYIPEGGCIINTSSVLGFQGSAGLIDYSATKGAVQAFTKSLAKNLIGKSIRVNAVAPGPVWTPLNLLERKQEEVKSFGVETIYGRPAQPEEIAPAYVYLASNITASYVTGETIEIFGSVSGGN